MPDGADRDLYQRFELEVRMPARRLLIDAFLPAPDALPSAVAPVAPPPPPIFQTDEMSLLAGLDRDEEPAPKPKPKKRAAAKKKDEAEEAPLSLQEEIAEFMSRGKTALAPDDEVVPSPASDPAAPAPGKAPAGSDGSEDPSDPGSDPKSGG